MICAREWFAISSRATPLQRAAVARLLRNTSRYALAPFAAMRTAGGWRLAACLDPPPHLDPEGMAGWQPDGDIVLIDPDTGKAMLADDDGGWIVGGTAEVDRVMLYSNGLTFARDWAAARLAWIDLNKRARVPGLPLREPLNHAMPGLLLAGPFGTVCHWGPLLDRARIAVDDPAMMRPLEAVLRRMKRIPVIEAAKPYVRAVAA